jgi:putative ABC transport system substrate-binding protein
VTAAAPGLELHILRARSEPDIDAAFTTLVRQRAGALLVASDPFFYTQREQLVALAARHAVPAIYQWRDFAVIGGLLSYGTNLSDAWRQAGIYAGKILKGAKPPTVCSAIDESRAGSIFNTAKALGLTVPLPLLGRADEVIE